MGVEVVEYDCLLILRQISIMTNMASSMTMDWIRSGVSNFFGNLLKIERKKESLITQKRNMQVPEETCAPHQKMILSVLAAIRARHTKVEKPDEFCVLLISMYCGMYGTTPPMTIAVEASREVTLVKLMRFHPFQSSQSSLSTEVIVMLLLISVSFTDSGEEKVRE